MTTITKIHTHAFIHVCILTHEKRAIQLLLDLLPGADALGAHQQLFLDAAPFLLVEADKLDARYGEELQGGRGWVSG